MTEGEFEQVIDELRQAYGTGWSKYFRESSTSGIRTELLTAMKEWVMVEVDEATSLIRFKSLLGVMTGEYPVDFIKGGTK